MKKRIYIFHSDEPCIAKHKNRFVAFLSFFIKSKTVVDNATNTAVCPHCGKLLRVPISYENADSKNIYMILLAVFISRGLMDTCFDGNYYGLLGILSVFNTWFFRRIYLCLTLAYGRWRDIPVGVSTDLFLKNEANNVARIQKASLSMIESILITMLIWKYL